MVMAKGSVINQIPTIATGKSLQQIIQNAEVRNGKNKGLLFSVMVIYEINIPYCHKVSPRPHSPSHSPLHPINRHFNYLF